MNGTETTSSSSASSLQAQLDSLRKLFVVTLVVLVCLAGAFDFYLTRQLANIRSALGTTSGIVDQFTKNELPNIQTFIVNLQTYAKTHPDINPILAKYGMAQAGASAPVSAPAKTK